MHFDSRKAASTRDKIDSRKLPLLLPSQRLRSWLGREDSNLRMAESAFFTKNVLDPMIGHNITATATVNCVGRSANDTKRTDQDYPIVVRFIAAQLGYSRYVTRRKRFLRQASRSGRCKD
jgi:hypothetical protein